MMIMIIIIKSNGRVSDIGAFRNSSFPTTIEKNMPNIPFRRVIAGQKEALPDVFVAGDTFQLRNDLMKAYPSAIYPQEKNIYHLSRDRRIVKTVFGILA